MSWYEDERRADLRWAEPPEEPRTCAECRFCVDVGIPRQHVKGKVWYESYDLRDGGDLDSLADELTLYTGMMWGDVLDGLTEALTDKAEEMLREAEDK